MLHLLACLLAVLSGLTFHLTARGFDLSYSAGGLVCATGFGLIASSLPMLKDRRNLKDVMVSIAIFAAYMAAISSIRNAPPRPTFGSAYLQTGR